MIKILAVNPTGFFSYGVHRTVELDGLGVILLEGKNNDRDGGSNGSGKTSLFNSLTQILFAKNPTGEYGSGVVNRELGKAFGRVIFLDSAGVKWRVTDVKKWRKTDSCPDDLTGSDPAWTDSYSGTDVYLDRWDGSSWVDERSSNKSVGEGRLELKATRRHILSVLGIDYDRFMSVSYLAQQQSVQFLIGTHKERMAILSEIADLNSWDSRVARVREDIKLADMDGYRAQQQLDMATAMVGAAVTDAELAVAQSRINQLTEKIDQANGSVRSIEDANSTIDQNIEAMNSQSSIALKLMNSLEGQRRQDELQLQAARNAYRQALDVAKSTPVPPEVSEATTRITELRWNSTAKADALRQLMTGAGRCNKCLSLVSDTHLIRQRELIAAEISEINATIIVVEAELKELVNNFDATVSAEISIAEATHGVLIYEAETALGSTNRNIAQAGQHMLTLEQNRKMEASKKRSTSGAYGAVFEAMAELSKANGDLEKLRTRQAAWLKQEVVIVEAGAKVVASARRVLYLKALDRLFGDKGVKAFKLDSALTSLNYLLQKYANVITDGRIDLWITQYREKTDGDLATDIQIMVREGSKEGVPFALYSGGERQQMVLAFIASFWELASNYGSGVNILCLDEIFGPLDDSNAEKVFSFVEALKLQGKSTIFVVTHDDSIKGRMPLDGVWTVVKNKHQSKIETT